MPDSALISPAEHVIPSLSSLEPSVTRYEKSSPTVGASIIAVSIRAKLPNWFMSCLLIAKL